MAQNMLVKVVSSLTGGGCGLWKSAWVGLIDDGGKRILPLVVAAVVGWAAVERSNVLSIVVVGVLEISNLISELFSLPLLLDP